MPDELPVLDSLTVAERRALDEEIRARKTRLSFKEFVTAVNPRYRWYRHCEVLADVLQRVADGKLKRVLVFMPPRHGKSEAVSRLFSAYYLYRYPHRWVGVCSYGDELAWTLSRAARDNFENAGGRTKQDVTAVKHWETDEGGGMWAAGVGGPILGKGYNLGLIDDPYKNAEEAYSQLIRDKHKDWYRSTFTTREEPNADGDPDGAVVIINQLWHEDDLSGWLLKEEEGDDETPERWHVVSFEAIKEESPRKIPASCTLEPDWREPGEALCPERRPIEKLERIKKRTGHFWYALYQQRPVPAEGACFQRKWFRRWRRDETGQLYQLIDPTGGDVIRTVRLNQCRRFGVVDLAFSLKREADYTVVSSWALSPQADLLLLDVHRARMQGPDIVPQCRAMFDQWDLSHFLMEANGAQLAIVDMARRAGMAVTALSLGRGDGDKITRSLTAQAYMESGQIYFPEHGAAPWIYDYENELLMFPKGSHDDCVDVTSHAAIAAFRRGMLGESDHRRDARDEAERMIRQREWLNVSNENLWQSGLYPSAN